MFTATTLALALALAPAQADGVQLKWNLKPGDVFYAKNSTVIDMKIGVAGQMIDQKQDITAVTRYRIKSAEGKGLVIELTYVDMKMTGAAGVDASAITEKLKGATVTATLNEKMDVTKIDGQKKLVEDLGGDDPAAKAMLGAMLSEDAMKQMFTSLFALTPEMPVKVGDTWNKTDTMDAGGIGKITAKTKHKLSKVDGDTATIESTADMTFKPGDGSGLPFKITKADFKIEKFAGTNTFDIKSGRLKEAKTEMSMNGTMTIGVMGQEIEATLSQKVKSTNVVTDKNPVKD